MSTDLDGQDAFDKILDRMVDAENRVQRELDRREISQSMISKLEADLISSRREVAGLKERLQVIENAESAVFELYAEIDKAVAALRLADESGADALHAAAAKLKTFIDPVPF